MTLGMSLDVFTLVHVMISLIGIGAGFGVLYGMLYDKWSPTWTLAFLFFTVLTNVTRDMILAREETFGPVAPLFKVEDDAEAIRLANDTEFGLAAYVYTRDLARSWRVTEALEYGIVGLNTGLISTEVAPFGGMKESGTGREGSKYGILEFTELKYVCVGGI